ncbi:MAG TPA: zf-TFIIB domain-containing protein [Hyphomicrobiaceae bacterium]|nr:zf-TFIIB domain-containing protein [Hyphomicrobiaceae bacterium]
MSVLNCPVCQGAMREITRNGVLIDTCTQCRGVWLDRGELEKLASIVTEPEPRSFLSGAMPARPRDDRPVERRDEHRGHWRDDDDDDDRRERRGGYGDRGPGERRRSFLDFFD